MKKITVCLVLAMLMAVASPFASTGEQVGWKTLSGGGVSAMTTSYRVTSSVVISFDDLIASKKAAGRPQDLVDVMQLERARAALEDLAAESLARSRAARAAAPGAPAKLPASRKSTAKKRATRKPKGDRG